LPSSSEVLYIGLKKFIVRLQIPEKILGILLKRLRPLALYYVKLVNIIISREIHYY
jgi:hypothetical protein